MNDELTILTSDTDKPLTVREEATALIFAEMIGADEPVKMAHVDAAENALKQFAIGRWVPVSERLPEMGWQGIAIHAHFGVGIFAGDKHSINHGVHHTRKCAASCWIPTDLTHWLDLSLPEVVG